MKKKKSKPSSKKAAEKEKREAAELSAATEEKSKVSSSILSTFKTAEFVSVDPEFKEVNFYVMQEEYDSRRKDFSAQGVDFKFERGDKDELSLYFSYALKPQ